jgi:AcrR family transcriptional regulator
LLSVILTTNDFRIQYSYTVINTDIVHPLYPVVKGENVTQTSKSKRRYNSARRQAQANENRRQIVDAAAKLFSLYGYSGATIDAIAQEAAVSSETVYAIFGNKRNILTNLIDISVGGDHRPIPLLQRPGPQAVLRENNPVHLLQLFAQDISGILERVAPVIEITRIAAKTEPEIAELLKNLLEQRLQNLASVIQHLKTLGSLREGIDESQATETIWVLSSPEVFILLLKDRGWTKEHYVDWLSDSLIRLLLP